MRKLAALVLALWAAFAPVAYAGTLSGTLSGVIQTTFDPTRGPAGRRRPGFTIVGATTIANVNAPSTVTFPTGTQAGDLALLYGMYWFAAPTIAGWTITNWTWTNGGYHAFVAQKVLTAADIGSPPSLNAGQTGGTLSTVVLRGVSSFTSQGTNEVTGSTWASPTYAARAADKASIVFVSDRDAASVPAAPVGWSPLIANFSGAIFETTVSLTTAPSYFGVAATWSPFVTTNFQSGIVGELQ